jgi:hypothetical protein
MNLFKYNTRIKSFFQIFRYNSNILGILPELWLQYPNADGRLCYEHATLTDNWTDVPTSWGGTFTGTYPQLPIEMRAYWHETLQKPIWKKADGTYVDATGTIV